MTQNGIKRSLLESQARRRQWLHVRYPVRVSMPGFGSLELTEGEVNDEFREAVPTMQKGFVVLSENFNKEKYSDASGEGRIRVAVNRAPGDLYYVATTQPGSEADDHHRGSSHRRKRAPPPGREGDVLHRRTGRGGADGAGAGQDDETERSW